MTTVPPRHSLEIGIVSSALETDYEVIEELGRGGMAVVYRAREKNLDREVAIKVLPSILSLDQGFVERFEREARTAAQLEHPSIVPIYRVGRSGSVIFFVMKFLRGQSLSAVLRERNKLTVDEVKRILLDCANALGYAAKRGVVHRDIKPDNVLLDHDGRCVITDFGIAKTSSGPMTAAGTSMGTPRYMSPEHAQGLPLDGRSDMYSLGVVAYQCLAGSIPFDGPDPFAVLYKHINSPLPVPELATEDEKALFTVIEKMLAKNPDERYQSADDLISALGGPTTPTSTTLVAGIMASRIVVEKTEIIPTGPTAHVKRFFNRRLPVWATFPALLALGVAGYVALNPPTPPPPPVVAPASPPPPAATKSVAQANSPLPNATPLSTVAGTSTGANPFGATTSTKAVTAAPGPAAPPKPKLPASRCPQSPKTLSLFVDSIRNKVEGSKFQVGYDVCGLTAGAAYTWEYAVRRLNQPRLSGLRGNATRPISDNYPEVANSARSHSSRLIDISTLPVGRYSFDVSVTDAKKRRAEKSWQFEITPKK